MQISKSFESLILPSAHPYPNVFWPPSQLSPSADGNAFVVRQHTSTVETPKGMMQTRDRIQTDIKTSFRSTTFLTPQSFSTLGSEKWCKSPK